MSKKHNKTRISSVRVGEKPTQERCRRNGGVTSEVVDRDINGRVLIKRYKSVWDCPLDVYRARHVIDDGAYEAGYKFRHAYFRAVLKIRVDDQGSGNEGDREMAALTPIYSERLIGQAYEALSPKQKAIIVDVCGHDECAGETAKFKTLLRGLSKLCEVWKINELGSITNSK